MAGLKRGHILVLLKGRAVSRCQAPTLIDSILTFRDISLREGCCFTGLRPRDPKDPVCPCRLSSFSGNGLEEPPEPTKVRRPRRISDRKIHGIGRNTCRSGSGFLWELPVQTFFPQCTQHRAQLGKKVKVPLGTLSSLFIKSDPKTLCLYANFFFR